MDVATLRSTVVAIVLFVPVCCVHAPDPLFTVAVESYPNPNSKLVRDPGWSRPSTETPSLAIGSSGAGNNQRAVRPVRLSLRSIRGEHKLGRAPPRRQRTFTRDARERLWAPRSSRAISRSTRVVTRYFRLARVLPLEIDYKIAGHPPRGQ